MSKPMQANFGWGGKRTGAGRKPGRMTKDVPKHTAGAILNAIDEIEEWKTLLQSKNEKIKITALIYLTDRRDGKLKQPVTGPDGGAIQHEHFDLSKLSTEQLDQLEDLIESAVVDDPGTSTLGETEAGSEPAQQ